MQKWYALSFAVENFKNYKKMNAAKKKGYKSIPFTQNFETTEKTPMDIQYILPLENYQY